MRSVVVLVLVAGVHQIYLSSSSLLFAKTPKTSTETLTITSTTTEATSTRGGTITATTRATARILWTREKVETCMMLTRQFEDIRYCWYMIEHS